jgi:tetratricopeptide (TPR) repeat protein
MWTEMRDAAETARLRFLELGESFQAMRALLPHGEALTRLRLPEQAVGELTEALEFFTAAGEDRWANVALSCLARNAMWSGDVELARERTAQSLAAARAQGDDRLVTVSLVNLAEQEFSMGNTERAIELARESLERVRNTRDTTGLAYALINLSAYFISQRKFEDARPFAHEGLRRALDMQNPGLTACAMQHLATIAAFRGEYERGALLLGSTNKFDAIFREATEQRLYDETIAMLRQALGEAKMSALLQRGVTVQRDQAIADALKV